jgi:hypothetical protein
MALSSAAAQPPLLDIFGTNGENLIFHCDIRGASARRPDVV